MLSVVALSYLEAELQKRSLTTPEQIQEFVQDATGRDGEMYWGDMTTNVRTVRSPV